MSFSFFRLRQFSWLPTLCLLAVTIFFSACQKDDTDNTDYAKCDKGLITNYIKDNNLTGFVRDSSGLYYAITQPSTGPNAMTGQTVSALYTGLSLDGKVFDSSASHGNTPISFPLGQGKVIEGWDVGFGFLNRGSKATLLIPSDLAYAGQSVGPLPGRSVLRFDVEVTNIQ